MAYTEQDCIDALSEADQKVDGALSAPEYKRVMRDDDPAVITMKRKFGSWNQAKTEAQLDKNSRGGQKKYVDESYFDDVDSETAYWLGFLIGDGSVTQIEGRQRRLSVQLHEDDKEHLMKFRECIGSEHQISHVNARPHVGLYITNDSLVDSLNRHGMDKNKMESGSMPSVDEGLRGDVVRGLFDADGSIGKRTWLVYGRRNRLEIVGEWIPVEYSLYEHRHDEHSSVYQLYVSGKDKLEELYNWLYTSEPYLDRKEQKFGELGYV